MSSELQQCVSDNCIRLFGFVDRAVVDFVPSSISLPDTPNAHTFINKVFQWAPRKHKHKPSRDSLRQAEKEAKALWSQKFGLLPDEDDSVDVSVGSKEKWK
ncbi:hypothetical protein VKT23_016585 [Stygiomarasmius scandens]|uniref:Uncharacterized protein n=1 Tax=Marasmiellus scandens TaxID=2682957 RepID=A0ABR1IU92_9AGAR